MKIQKRWSSLKILTILAVFIFLEGCDTRSKDAVKPPFRAELMTSKLNTTDDFQISLAQWSLHKSFFGNSNADWQKFNKTLTESPDDVLQGKLDPADFPEIAASYGISIIELVNTFYFGKTNDKDYWIDFKHQCDSLGISVGLIMCDALGDLGDADAKARNNSVENHYQWVDIAKFIGAHSIRVNAGGSGTRQEVALNVIDGLSKLGTYAASQDINILVENHGGYSSDAHWLSGIIKKVDMPHVGTLPDFGNFCIEMGSDGCIDEYDRYQGISELMPYAKGVSAKSLSFDHDGNEINTDFLRMMTIVKASGFKGTIGIEYEGRLLSEDAGIKATKALLEKVINELKN